MWAAFPVNASPRPLVVVGGTTGGPRGVYGNGETKLAVVCGDFARPTQLSDGPGTAGGFHLISASTAFATLQPKQRTGSCATLRSPLTLTDARLGEATYYTDRGPRSLPAWLFAFTGVEGQISVLAIAAQEYWSPAGLAAGPGPSGDWAGAVVGPDDRTLTVSFIGAQSENGPCGVRYGLKLTESPTAVMVTRIDHPNDSTAICTLVGYLRSASAVLKAPLGARVLVDDHGYPMGATGNP